MASAAEILSLYHRGARPFVVRVPDEHRDAANKLLVEMTEFAATRLRSIYEKFIASGTLQRYADDWQSRAAGSSAAPLAKAGALISRALAEMGYPEAGHEHDGRGEAAEAIRVIGAVVLREKMNIRLGQVFSETNSWSDCLLHLNISTVGGHPSEVIERLGKLSPDTIRAIIANWEFIYECLTGPARAFAFMPPADSLAAAESASRSFTKSEEVHLRMREKVFHAVDRVAADFEALLRPGTPEEMEWLHGVFGTTYINSLRDMFHGRFADVSAGIFTRSLPFYENYALYCLTPEGLDDDTKAPKGLDGMVRKLLSDPRRFPHIGVKPELRVIQARLGPIAGALRAAELPQAFLSLVDAGLNEGLRLSGAAIVLGEILDAIAPSLETNKHTRLLLRELDDYEAALRVIGLNPGSSLRLAVNLVVAPARLLLSPADAELQRLIEEEERAAVSAPLTPEPATTTPVAPALPAAVLAKKWNLLHVENPGSPTPRGAVMEVDDAELVPCLTKLISSRHPDLPIPAASAARAIRHYLVETPAEIKRVMSKEAVGPIAYHKLKRGGARIYVRESDGVLLWWTQHRRDWIKAVNLEARFKAAQ